MAKINYKSANFVALLFCLCSIFFLQGCSYREALRGKHEDMLGSHQVTINKPCSLFTENATRIENVPGLIKYQYTCGETNVAIVLKDEELTIYDKSYGRLGEGDSIVFDHGKVFINAREVQEVASK
jgi:hypothetical protein